MKYSQGIEIDSFFDHNQSTGIGQTSRKWSRMELDLDLDIHNISMFQTSFEEQPIHANTNIHIQKICYEV
jgi:hypothetical protein